MGLGVALWVGDWTLAFRESYPNPSSILTENGNVIFVSFVISVIGLDCIVHQTLLRMEFCHFCQFFHFCHWHFLHCPPHPTSKAEMTDMTEMTEMTEWIPPPSRPHNPPHSYAHTSKCGGLAACCLLLPSCHRPPLCRSLGQAGGSTRHRAPNADRLLC